MSKHKHRKGRRRLVANLAGALNACEDAGLRVWSAPGGAVWCELAVLVPPVEKGQRWEVKPLTRLRSE